MREQFTDWKPAQRSLDLVVRINTILDDYAAQGYRLTLRQLYYQLVAGDIIPNSDREYKKIGSLVSNARMAGWIDWDMIEDRVRIPKNNSHWETPGEIIKSAARSYYLDRWEHQDNYVEVWCEKDAVSNILTPVCSLYDVTFMANRGYSSQSAMYRASKRFEAAHFEGKVLHLIYLGDHDPSGIDMTRDISDRMTTFLEWREYVAEEDIHITVERIALNMEQIQQYNPPENPAKQTDSRFKGYADLYGTKSWELDALKPRVLESILTDEILQYIDQGLWDEVVSREKSEKKELIALSKNWGHNE